MVIYGPLRIVNELIVQGLRRKNIGDQGQRGLGKIYVDGHLQVGMKHAGLCVSW